MKRAYKLIGEILKSADMKFEDENGMVHTEEVIPLLEKGEEIRVTCYAFGKKKSIRMLLIDNSAKDELVFALEEILMWVNGQKLIKENS